MPIRLKDLMWPAITLVVALVLRYAVVEVTEFAQTCDVSPWSGWCAPRTALLVITFGNQMLGWTALALGLIATFTRSRALAIAGLSLGVAGMTLFSFEPATAAVLASALVLVRLNENEGVTAGA